jgi:hypothetical protein
VARNYIEEKILTCSCPRCGMAFVDFEGCFALKCARCPCNFCAWCLADCGDSSDGTHVHVRACMAKPVGADMYFGRLEDFQQAMKRRSRRLLREYLPTLDPQTRTKVLQQMRDILRPILTDHYDTLFRVQ